MTRETYELARLNYPLVASYLKKSKDLLVPFGTLEAHGKHLPISTDTVIAREICRRLSEKLAMLYAPPLEYGITNSLFRYPAGSYIEKSVYKNFVGSILQSFSSHGFRRIFLINGHGGNNESLNELVTEMAKKPGHRLAVIHWWVTIKEITVQFYGKDTGHAGAAETALVSAADHSLLSPDFYSEDTIYHYPEGVVAHPVPGTILVGANENGEPDFDAERNEVYTQKVVSALQSIIERIRKGWDDLDLYECDRQ